MDDRQVNSIPGVFSMDRPDDGFDPVPPPAQHIQWSAKKDQLFAAFALAALEMPTPKKLSRNPHFGSKYADLSEVTDASKAVLAKYGIAQIGCLAGERDGVVTLTTIYGHKSGQWLSITTTATLQKRGIQDLGSCVSYLRRYSATAACNLAAEDDDGEAVMGRGHTVPTPAAPPVEEEKISDEEALSAEEFRMQINACESSTELAAVADVIRKSGLPRTAKLRLSKVHNEMKLKLAADGR